MAAPMHMTPTEFSTFCEGVMPAQQRKERMKEDGN